MRSNDSRLGGVWRIANKFSLREKGQRKRFQEHDAGDNLDG